MSVRLFYVDDSGSPESRLVVFGWVELLAVDWSSALRVWLDWRRHLHTTVGIPASYELHATKFGSGRGRPSGTDWDLHKANRATTMVSALTTIAALSGVATGAVYRPIMPCRHYYDTRTALYAELINRPTSGWPETASWEHHRRDPAADIESGPVAPREAGRIRNIESTRPSSAVAHRRTRWRAHRAVAANTTPDRFS
jgi:hypothetical protein